MSQGFLRPYSSAFTLLMRAIDWVLIFGLHVVAVVVRDEAWRDIHTQATIVTIVVFSFASQSLGLYQARRGQRLSREIWDVFLSWFAAASVLLSLGFLAKTSTEYSRAIMLIWGIGTPLAIATWRIGLRVALRELRKSGHNTRAAAVAGLTRLGERVGSTIMKSPEMGFRFAGFYDDRSEKRGHPMPEELEGREGNFEALIQGAKSGEIDTVYIALPLRAEPRINELVRRLADTTASVYMAADFDAFDLLNAQWGSFGDVPVVSIHETPFYGVDGWLKRAEDIVVGSMILLLITIPMMVVAIGVKLTSKGPIFFRQKRYGLNGDVIHVLKFRSMTVAEDGDKVVQATRGDKRITKFGGFLRRTSLDELPQFLNVITGEMSIVGPRPHAVAHNELYRKRIQGYMLRHKVKPGITGWAQVNGWRGETDTLEKMEKRVEHDLYYIRNWGLLWDIKIIFLTVFGRAVRQNAY